MVSLCSADLRVGRKVIIRHTTPCRGTQLAAPGSSRSHTEVCSAVVVETPGRSLCG